MKEAWLGDADRVGQKMTHPLWRPGYGPAKRDVVHSQNSKCEGSKISVAKHHLKVALHVQLMMRRGFCTSVLSFCWLMPLSGH